MNLNGLEKLMHKNIKNSVKKNAKKGLLSATKIGIVKENFKISENIKNSVKKNAAKALLSATKMVIVKENFKPNTINNVR